MNIQVDLFEGELIYADMAVAMLIQNGMSKKAINETLKPHKVRIKGNGNTRFIPLAIVEAIINPNEDPIEEEESEATNEDQFEGNEEPFFLHEDASDADLIRAFYESASNDDYCSPFLSGMARILKTSPKKLFRRLSKLLHPDTTTIHVEGWEIGVLKEAQQWCEEMECYETEATNEEEFEFFSDSEEEEIKARRKQRKEKVESDGVQSFTDFLSKYREDIHDATCGEKKSYRKLVKLLHPDSTPYKHLEHDRFFKKMLQGLIEMNRQDE
ncbi:J domain-containing protein [Bacillus sp. V3B]|uniref:J domain-containing protein n=1 Tax=Bacillus sp. V3B TaxID=2804915 RepID=UPI0021099B1A|nr:J domain-containing protein [Bacillus sp. V3B]